MIDKIAMMNMSLVMKKEVMEAAFDIRCVGDELDRVGDGDYDTLSQYEGIVHQQRTKVSVFRRRYHHWSCRLVKSAHLGFRSVRS